MSVFGGSSQLNFRLANPSIQPCANLRTKAFCSSVPSINEMEIVSPGCHLLPLTMAALAKPSVGGAAAYHEKHHFFSWAITSSFLHGRDQNAWEYRLGLQFWVDQGVFCLAAPVHEKANETVHTVASARQDVGRTWEGSTCLRHEWSKRRMLQT